MEQPPLRRRVLPCAQNLIPICESPDGPKTDKHHELAKCLKGMAKLEGRSKEYIALLAEVISHPMNGVEICWCLHHKYGVQAMSENTLPTASELEGKKERWNG